ncbi:tRNA modification GTPase TrmE [Lactarius akahatsu]|uniref:tRNA modification GTPase TrmE n=1 Tax=Lactarius akahatsu TaxID=416441 RepID=A0AAD4LPN2_9AGAM|nr:tRNA modification GTPase TrmE [Lactarius akahatsu]
MLSATSRIALLSIARNTRLRTTILTSRNIRACRLTTTATTAHGCDTLRLSDAQRKTIYALSTPPGKSGVAIIRVSGPEALSIWQRMVRSARGTPPRPGRDKGDEGRAKARPSPRLPEAWKLERCHIVDPHTSEILDEALAVFFRAPRSFTTEDVLELHVHGGRAVVGAVLAALARFPGCRPAASGEFTRRAYEGGRLDLTQVEGLRDLVDADTESQRRAALRVARGGARAQFDALREEVVACLALVEALIDFGEGEELEEGVFAQARQQAQRLRDKIQSILSDNRRGEIVRAGIRLAIFGPPNVGKSSLLNFLAQREAAIVTRVPGTTRDILELSLDIGGLPVSVADTAGLRETADEVEQIGIERARKLVQVADASILVLSFPDAVSVTPSGPRLEIPVELAPLVTPSTFILLNKTDLVPASAFTAAPGALPQPGCWAVSLASQSGTDEFLAGLATELQDRYNILQDAEGENENASLITHARHRAHLETALGFLDAFLDTRAPEDVVLGAEELRYAAQAVGKISGLVDVEDVLDVIFSQFCIGK